MSELALFKRRHDATPIEGVEFIPLPLLSPREIDIREAAKHLFGSQVGLYAVDSVQIHLDELFTEAQGKIHAGEPFATTRLHAFLWLALDSSDAVALWYASDYTGLPVAADIPAFMAAVEEGVSSTRCECYIRWQRPGAASG